jgi:ABC-type ATPase involved in cell division
MTRSSGDKIQQHFLMSERSMEDYRESTVVVTRLWEALFRLAPPSAPPTETYSHGLLLLFLVSEEGAYYERFAYRLSEAIAGRPPDRLVAQLLGPREIIRLLDRSTDRPYPETIALVFDAVIDALRSFGYKGPQQHLFNVQADWARRQFDLVVNWASEHGMQHVLDAFDHGQRERIGNRRDVGREDFAAYLARSCTIEPDATVADLGSPTACLPRLAIAAGMARPECIISQDVTDHFTAMRLCMQGVYFRYVDLKGASPDGLALPIFADFLLLDPTPATGGKTTAQQPGGDAEFAMSATHLAQQLPRLRDRFGLALVVVPQLACTTTHWQSHVREELLAAEMVAAVVDLPASALTGRRKFSAWLITGRRAVVPAHRRKVLFIDAEPLGRLTPAHDVELSADFIGALIAPLFQADGHRNRLLERLEHAEPLLANIFEREFDDAAYEAPGLSRSVPYEAIREQHAILAAKTYLTPMAGDLWERGIDRRQLDALLETAYGAGQRIYIIGNNGEGKSLLLRDIAVESASRRRPTVVIAFSATDRFPRKLAPEAQAFYRYMGARTNTTGINTLQAAVDIGALMLRIHADPEMLEVLNRVLDLVGFASQLFMIPRELKANGGQQRGLISGIVRLASQDASDRQLIDVLQASPLLAKKYKLGLRRAHHRDTILPFDELSSGEHQIIMLAAKMISEAKRNVLFLVDEPEISLHVGWQRIVPKLFEMVAREFGADVLVATHSPVLVAGADGDGDHCFTVRDRALNALPRQDRNSVETALFEGFRTYTSNNREVHERCAALVAQFIEEANSDDDPRQSAQPILDKLDDMKQVIDHQRRFLAREEMGFDVNLIEQAKAAVREMAALAVEDTGEEEA